MDKQKEFPGPKFTRAKAVWTTIIWVIKNSKRNLHCAQAWEGEPKDMELKERQGAET